MSPELQLFEHALELLQAVRDQGPVPAIPRDFFQVVGSAINIGKDAQRMLQQLVDEGQRLTAMLVDQDKAIEDPRARLEHQAMLRRRIAELEREREPVAITLDAPGVRPITMHVPRDFEACGRPGCRHPYHRHLEWPRHCLEWQCRCNDFIPEGRP